MCAPLLLLFSARSSRAFLKKKSRNDLEWDGESKRIIAVGDGKEK
jgi:hypothetical protein